jgi:hypothetical protein
VSGLGSIPSTKKRRRKRKNSLIVKKDKLGWWLTPIILATWKGESSGMVV